MSNKSTGCGVVAILGSLVFLGVAFLVARGRVPVPAMKLSSGAAAIPRAAPAVEPVSRASAGVWAAVSQFAVNKATRKFNFRVDIENEESRPRVVYAVVYGTGDTSLPPRRSAWPNPEEIFHMAGTERGVLAPADIAKQWDSRPDNTKGQKVDLAPNGRVSLKGWLPMEETSPHKPWEARPIDPNSLYGQVHIWIFSDTGSLLFKESYNLE